MRHWKINGTSTEHHLRKRSKTVTPIATFAIPKGPKGSGRLDDWKSKLRRTGPPARPQKRKSSNRCNDISLFPQVVSQGSFMNFPMANPFRKLLNPLEKQTKINIPKSPRGIPHTKFEIPCTATSSERKSLIYLCFSNEISTRSPTEIHETFMGHHLRKQWKIVTPIPTFAILVPREGGHGVRQHSLCCNPSELKKVQIPLGRGSKIAPFAYVPDQCGTSSKTL